MHVPTAGHPPLCQGSHLIMQMLSEMQTSTSATQNRASHQAAIAARSPFAPTLLAHFHASAGQVTTTPPAIPKILTV